MKTLQIRNVPDDLHRQLKARAALAGQSISDYLLLEVRQSLQRPTRAELAERVSRRTAVLTAESSEDAVRAGREDR